MTWLVRVPFPGNPIRIVVREAVPCSCATTPPEPGLVEDEGWQPRWSRDERDPTWPGNGYLVCGSCDGDGWHWQQVEPS